MSDLAIEELLKRKNELVAERDSFVSSINDQISGLESAIELLSGKKVWEVEKEPKYDDENPNYIKGSFEEM